MLYNIKYQFININKNKMSTSENLRELILKELKQLNIAWFLYTELEKILPLLNYYKLHNLYDNIEELSSFLLSINNDFNSKVDNLLLNEIINEK